MESTPDDAEAAAAATATPPGNETEDRDSTHVRAATRGDEIPSSTKPRRRDGSPSSVSTNSGGLVTPSADASGGRSWKTRSTPRLFSSRRESSDYEGSEVSLMRASLTRSSRRLFRDNSVGQRSSSTRSVLSHGSSGSTIDPKTPVSVAIKAAGDGDARTVVQFLNSGGDINAKCKTGASTPLSRAAAKGHLKIVKLLLDRGAAVNLSGRGGLTPLHEAAGSGKVEVCRSLLGGGAAVAAHDHAKRSPLHYAGSSVEVTKLLLEFGADPNAQDKNGQRPDAMAINREARALLRDARCAVREDAVGDNASRVIASLRRELENQEREAHAAKESASEEEARRKEIELEVDQLRGHLSKLSEENEILRKEAAARGPIEQVSEATQAELKQMRASLHVARAAVSEEKRRREILEDGFDSHVAEAVAKAIAVAASRLLDRMPESEEEEEGGGLKRAELEEDVDGDGEERASKSAGGNAWEAGVGEIEPDHGDGDANLPEPVRAVPSAWGGKIKDGGKSGDGDADDGHADDGDADGSDADGGDADGGDDGSDAENKEEEQDGKGFVDQQRTDEMLLIEATAGALLPRSTTLRRCYSAGPTPPRQAAGSPTWASTKGYGSEGSKPDAGRSGCSGGAVDAQEKGGGLLTVKARSLENVLQGESTERIESGQPFSVARSISVRAPVGADWTGTNEDNQDERGTASGAAAPPSTTSEDLARGAGIGNCISAPVHGDDGDDRESSVSPGHGIGVSAEPIAARGDGSPGDCAETAEGQEEGAAAGGLGGDTVPLVLEDLTEEMVAALEVKDEEDDYLRYEGDDDDYYDGDDDDDDIDFFNYLSKYETESSKDVGQTTDARVWEGMAAALKVELEEKKARIFDLSIENRRLRREAADWAEQYAYQMEQHRHQQLEQQQQQQQQQQQGWWQQWWGQLWWGQQEDDKISLHERVGMCETETKPEGGTPGRMFRGIPRVAHAYWEH